MAGEAIASIAILKVNFDRQGRDYIENFVPFVSEILRGVRRQPLTVADLQSALRTDFGLAIPQAAVDTIAKRLRRRGLATRDQRGRYLATDAVDTSDFEEVRNQAVREEKALVHRLVEFSGEYGPRLTFESAEQLLLQYIAARGPSLLGDLLGSTTELDVPPAASFELVHRFVIAVRERDPEGFRYLDTMVKGSLLLAAIQLPDQGRVASRFENLDVYLDTRFLLRALGLAGPIPESPAKELLQALFELGANLRVFDSTLSEVVRVLTAVENSLRYGSELRLNSSEVLEHLAAAGYRASDVALTITRLPRLIATLRAKVVRVPPPSAPLTIDELGFSARLRDRAGGPAGYREDALAHDVDAITAIYRLRRGEAQPLLEYAKAIFLTTNTLLVRTSNQFFRPLLRAQSFPLAVTDDELGTLVWLKRPSAAPTLPAGLAIANSYAAMRPPVWLWRAYIDEIARLEKQGDITEDDYYALRYSLTALEEVSARSHAGAEALKESVPEILARVRRVTEREVRARLESQVAATVGAVAEGRVSVAQDDAEMARVAASSLASAASRQRAEREQRIAELSTQIASAACMLLKIPAIILIALFVYAGVEPFLSPITHVALVPGRLDPPAREVVAIAAVIVCVLGVLAAWRGTTLNVVFRPVEVRLSRRIDFFLRARIG